ncbi:hypothetical protein BGZ60DRAFT_91061 [Tricladium varicosporioides]|nr:hypothetical protein BGZ60DRAFT_91061 [Hymenoscyphus varicosporioides]
MALPLPPSLEKIRIAIICPLPIELAAVQEVLDEEYEDLAQAFSCDPNTYTFGRIGKHYVVVAGLPSSLTGTASASSVADNLQRTFTSVRVLLLVGIGGGVPTHDHDIRLGDVVVSQPTGRHGGAVNYNFGKARQGGRFEPLDFLASPSREVLSALGALQAKHLRHKTNLGKYIAEFQEKDNEVFRYPGQDKDFLFDASIPHSGDGDCASCGKSRERTARNPPYIRDIPGPYIHYGLIASADNLMTDSILRDRLNDSYGGQILCFEMEAAGILRSYPCLVIRGISDYCDSHKRRDKAWHGWASATAAAYAKDFINELPAPSFVEPPMISDVVKEKIFLCPYTENSEFIGRTSILKEIQRKLQHGDEQAGTKATAPQTRRTVVLYGLGGVGKSQIAISYLYWLHRKFPDLSIFWIHAATTQRFYQAYLEIAEKCQIPRREDPKADHLQLVKNWLQDKSNGPWFMVIDNADNNSDFFDTEEGKFHPPPPTGDKTTVKKLASYIPRCPHGSILVTSRNKEVAINFAIQKGAIEVKKMSGEESKALLSSILSERDYSQNDLEHLGLLLGHLPLALIQAASYIEAKSCSITTYIAMFEESKDSALRLLSKGFAAEGRDQDIPNAVAISWMLSFDQIREHNPRAADLLSLMSFFDRQAIPESLLKDVNETSFSFIEAIGELLSYSLITRNITATQYDIHRFAHLVSRAWQVKNGLIDKWYIAAEERLLERFPKDDYAAWEICALYLPHIQALIDEGLGKWLKTYNKNTVLLMNRVGNYLRLRGLYDLAEGVDKQCLGYCTECLGLENPATLISIANLASTYQSQGRWKEAEELKVQVMEANKRVLGLEHPDTLTSIANLALTYQSQGRWKEAEELKVQVMEASKRVLGLEHPSTLTSIANLASTFWNQGRWKEAEELEVQVMEARKRVLGLEHPSTLTSIANLASTFWNQGRWKEAEELEVQVMEARKRVLGLEHPSTLTSIANLASTYQSQGRWKEAEELEVQVMEASKRVLGLEHPSMLTSMANLAVTYQGQGRSEDAFKLMEECIALQTRILGTNHPDTLSSNVVLLRWKTELEVSSLTNKDLDI